MSKVKIEDISIEIINGTIKLSYDTSKYKLETSHTSNKSEYQYDSNISSLANQINSVESDTRPYDDK